MASKLRRLDVGLHPKSVIRITWWGNATVVIESIDRSIVIDPWVHPKEGDFQFVFCTHEHYAHADPDTVERLTQGRSFQRLFLARSCLYPSNKKHARHLKFLSKPTWQIGKYVIFYPKHFDHSRPWGAEGDTAQLAGSGRELQPSRNETETRTPGVWTPRPFAGIDEIWVDGWHVEGMEMLGDDPEVSHPLKGAMPQLGFFIEDLVSGVSFYHMGANRRPYQEMAEIRGRLDVLLLPIGRMTREHEIATLDLTRPRCVIPIGWRDPDPAYPIPAAKAGAGDDFAFETPADPLSHIRDLDKVASKMGVRVAAIKGGIPYRF